MQEDELVGVQWMPLEEYFEIPFTATRQGGAVPACRAAARLHACRRPDGSTPAPAGRCRPVFQKIHAACRAYANGTYR